MNRKELRNEFYKLTEREIRQKSGESLDQSHFYRFLESNGYKDEDGIYHMPSISFSYQNPNPPETLDDRINQSPLQKIFRLKKATRYEKEPFYYADFISVRFVYDGEDMIYTPDSHFLMKKNDICLMNSGFVLCQRIPHDQDIVFTVMFEKDYVVRSVLNRMSGEGVISRFLYNYVLESKSPQNYILFHGNGTDRMPRLFEDIVMEYLDPQDGSEMLLETYVQQMLIDMLRMPYEYEQTDESHRSFIMAKILDYIDQHYQSVTLKELSDRFGYHADYISRTIRKLSGHNFRDYILHKKMVSVCRELAGTNLSVHDIMERNGFYNETYFYKKFHQLFGMNPAEYRRKVTR